MMQTTQDIKTEAVSGSRGQPTLHINAVSQRFGNNLGVETEVHVPSFTIASEEREEFLQKQAELIKAYRI